MSTLKDKFTLVIPTYNRPDDLADLLKYFEAKNVQFPVLVLDSSRNEFRERNERAVSQAHLDAKIIFFHPEVHPYDKLAQGLATLQTPFVQICADDDLVVPEKIADCVDFLEGHPDYSVCHGRSLNVHVANGDRVYLQWEQFVPSSFDSEDPAQRLAQFFEQYGALFYGVFRTPQWQQWLQESAKLQSYLYKELFLGVMPVIEGKVARLDEITNLRYSGQPATPIHLWQPTGWILNDFSDFWKNYENFREVCLNTLAERMVSFPQGKLGKQIFDSSFLYYLRSLVPEISASQVITNLRADKKTEPQKGPPPIRFLRILKLAIKYCQIYYPLKLSTTACQVVFDSVLKGTVIPKLEKLEVEYKFFLNRPSQKFSTTSQRQWLKVQFAYPILRALGRAIMTIRQGRLPQTQKGNWITNLAVKVLKALGVQFVGININRIGHLASEYDCLIKAENLGLKTRTKKVIFPPSLQKPANTELFKYFRKYGPVVTSPRLYQFLEPIAKHPDLFLDTYPYQSALNETCFYFSDVLPSWNARPPIVSVSQQDHDRAKQQLKELGIGPDQWYVGVHARTEDFAPNDDQQYRNTNIETLNLAIDAIIRRGGICIRMGDARMPKISERMGLIDYAHSPLRSEFLDFYLSATSRFFLGSCSGMASIPVLFGKPVVSVNMSPMSHALAYTFRDINLPKLLWSEKLQRMLTFPEIMNSSISNFRYGFEYRDAGITVVDNTPEEIREAVVEMMDRLEGRSTVTSEDDQLQNQFRSLFRDGHYTWKGQGRVGKCFLQKHQDLFKGPDLSNSQQPSFGPMSDRSL